MFQSDSDTGSDDECESLSSGEPDTDTDTREPYEDRPLNVHCTVDEHQIRFATAKSEYHQKLCSKDVQRLVEWTIPPSGFPITKAIAVGLGTFCSNEHEEIGIRSFIQLASFLHITALLQGHTDKPIQKIVQDPDFKDVDEEFLQGLGIQVVKSPTVEEAGLIDGNTFLYAPFCPFPSTAQMLSYPNLPALYVGNHIIDIIWFVRRRLYRALRVYKIARGVMRRVREERRSRLWWHVQPEMGDLDATDRCFDVSQTCKIQE
ncbi:hypothetical protein B0H63DRAFT_551932 [Podospora didyma]|uniref:SRR1-like domain-containing protein n=1 Tax=Podospora didyma TaxID=330526 RepID=A0AAE0N4J1_9PEZI|nr:hypothetical protein B0H63DRAFT_551932 [Podospora didyma]